MACMTIQNTRIAGLASAVPEKIRSREDEVPTFGQDEVSKISENIGVKVRHIVTENLCTSDLCFAAAIRLMSDIEWQKESIDAMIFISQTPDYVLPSTSCVLHGRLGLPKACATFDINLGCSGYIYGLWVASCMIAAAAARRVLLLVGDTISRIVSKKDRSVALLFGDSGTATLLEKDDNASPMLFSLGTDGSGANNLIVPSGGFRSPHSDLARLITERENGNFRSDEDLYMNGPEIFNFTLKEIPSLIKGLDVDFEKLDAVVMHQANKFMLEYLAKRLKIPSDKMIISLENYGNTSSASVPLAMTTSLLPKLRERELDLLLAGFGVGYSWGAVKLTCGPLIMPDLISVSDIGIQNLNHGNEHD